jgi:hypothetical protein
MLRTGKDTQPHRGLRLVFALLACCCIATSASAQVRVGPDSATRLDRFARDLGYGVVEGLAYAEVDQLSHNPPQWGSGWDGYRLRATSDIGEFVIQESTTEALAAAMKRPLDYQPCRCGGFGRRVGWALWETFTDYTRDGKHPIALPRIIGAYSGSFAQASWRPGERSHLRTAMLNGTTSLLIGAGINLFHEFRTHHESSRNTANR